MYACIPGAVVVAADKSPKICTPEKIKQMTAILRSAILDDVNTSPHL